MGSEATELTDGLCLLAEYNARQPTSQPLRSRVCERGSGALQGCWEGRGGAGCKAPGPGIGCRMSSLQRQSRLQCVEEGLSSLA